jgi:hypothetical protein
VNLFDQNPTVLQSSVQELLLQGKPILLEQMPLQHLEKTLLLMQTFSVRFYYLKFGDDLP